MGGHRLSIHMPPLLITYIILPIPWLTLAVVNILPDFSQNYQMPDIYEILKASYEILFDTIWVWFHKCVLLQNVSNSTCTQIIHRYSFWPVASVYKEIACVSPGCTGWNHDDVIKWNHFLRYWPFVRGSHPSSVKSPHKGQWRGALMFSLICAGTNCSANYREANGLGRHRVDLDVTVMERTV